MLVGGGNSFETFNYVIARSWRVSRLQVSGFFILVTSTQVLSSSLWMQGGVAGWPT